MKKLTKQQQIINYFTKHPLTPPKIAATKFNVAVSTVYTLRKRAMRQAQEIGATEMLGPQIDVQDVAAVVIRANERQVGGDHYKAMGVEPWNVVDTWPIEQRIGAYRHGALKYIMRMGSKDVSAQEISKGQHYLQKLLEVIQEAE